jgi:predicted NBD/HSP70 family sugar kinase
MMDNLNNFDAQFMKELCANSIRRVLKNLRNATADELANTAHIDRETTAGIVTELCRSGEFLKTGEAYCFNSSYKLILAVCVFGKNKVSAAVCDLYGEYLIQSEIPGNPNTLDFFNNIVEEYLKKYPAIALLAFGMAGFEEKRSHHLITVDFPNLEWSHFLDHFMERFGLPAILENEINAAVLALYKKHNLGEGKCATAIYVPRLYGPGSAICIDGEIYHGRDNAAGEVIFLNTDVRWRHFELHAPDYSKIVDPVKVVADIAISFVAILNPDLLAVYSDWLPENTIELLRNYLFEAIPREFHPEIVFLPNILPDSLDGLASLALKALDPKADFTEDEE